MSFAMIISQFGYPALAVGVFLEGETVLILAAFMAHRGYLNLPVVILLGGIAAFAADQFFSWLGRTRGSQFIAKRPAWQSRLERAKSLLGRNTDLLFLGVRFMYGLRTVLTFAIGMSKLDPKRFALLDFISALLWALIFGMAGYLFGQLLESIFKNIAKYESWIALGIIAIGTGVALLRWYILGPGKDASR